MSTHRRITRFLTAGVAGASLMVGLTACHVPFTDVEDGARTAAHDPALHQFPQKISEMIAEIPGALSDLNEVTDGPTRDAVIETACDAAAKGDHNPDWESNILDNLLNETQPPGKQLLDAVQNLAVTISDDEHNGTTTLEKVGTVCQVYQLEGKFS